MVLEQLPRVGQATWRPFDWDADDWDRDTVPLAAERVVARADRVVILDGAYSCRPELHDLLDLRVLLDIPGTSGGVNSSNARVTYYRSDWDARLVGRGGPLLLRGHAGRTLRSPPRRSRLATVVTVPS